MASIIIRWPVPSDILASATAYTFTVYRSTAGEDEDYSAIASSQSAGGGNITSTYTDTGGDVSHYYFVRYTPAGGSEGDRIIAFLEPTVREQRIAQQIEAHLPEIVKARIDSNLLDIRKAMKNALSMVNAYSPVTAYGISNMPDRFESAIVLLTLVLLYVEKQLQIAIRDYTYGGTGINLNVDRNSKFASTLQALQKQVNELLVFVKHGDWPTDPLGMGSYAMNAPQARILGMVLGSGSY